MTRRVKRDCYRDAFNALSGQAFEGWRLVHGYPTGTGGEAEGLKYGHAWLLSPDEVWVFETQGSLLVTTEAYYRIGQIDPEECSVFTLTEARMKALETGVYGVWGTVPAGVVFMEKGKIRTTEVEEVI